VEDYSLPLINHRELILLPLLLLTVSVDMEVIRNVKFGMTFVY
jgi:hypothetical protein